ncbi:amino acid permease [Capsulimonas corticalis]|uniref:Amino acid permease n=1 Tax=Capsulimonas corticalis TaxID=2219043 RepID=A0A402D1Q4_9BACT|nr:APC family permease [Capsulimonas corticalis]BDI28653.1 amino acid permease [Capsulimonas corticalis]
MATVQLPADHLDLGEHNHHAVGYRRDALSSTETLAQSIANIAPTLTPAVNLQLVFGSSGNGTWFTYLLATLGLLLIGVCIKQFASKTATPGALYSYVTKSLGPTAGFITGWALILAYLTTGIAVASYTAPYAQTLLKNLNIAMPAMVMFVLVVGLVWFVAYRDVRLSAKMMLILEGVSISLIFVLGLLMVAHTGLHLGPQLSLKGMTLTGLQGGMVLGIFSFVGFESATALGAEARDPKRSIPRAVFMSTAIAGTFFMIMSFMMVSAFSAYKTHLDDPNLVALTAMADIAHAPVLGVLVSIGAIVSLFACSLACVTATSRILSAMSRDGLIHAHLGKSHDTNATPHIAATVCAAIMIVVLFGLSMKHVAVLDIYNMNGMIATYGFLLAYILIAVGAVVSASRDKSLSPMLIFSAVAGVLFMGLAVKGSVYPWPVAPDNYLPQVFAGYMAVGIVWMLIERMKSRGSSTAIA